MTAKCTGNDQKMIYYAFVASYLIAALVAFILIAVDGGSRVS